MPPEEEEVHVDQQEKPSDERAEEKLSDHEAE